MIHTAMKAGMSGGGTNFGTILVGGVMTVVNPLRDISEALNLAEDVSNVVIAKIIELESRVMSLSQIIEFRLLDIVGHDGARFITSILEKEGLLAKPQLSRQSQPMLVPQGQQNKITDSQSTTTQASSSIRTEAEFLQELKPLTLSAPIVEVGTSSSSSSSTALQDLPPFVSKPAEKTLNTIDLGKYNMFRQYIVDVVAKVKSEAYQDYSEERKQLTNNIGNMVSGRMRGLVESAAINPVAGFGASIAADKMQPIIARAVERFSVLASSPVAAGDSTADLKLHELKQRAEHLARIAELSRSSVVSAGDDEAFHDTKSSVSKKDSQLSFTAKRAEDIISLAKDYAEFAAKYPKSAYMLETALLPTISVSAKAIAGAVVGGPAGAAGGAMAGICAEVQAIVVHEVAGERIAEVVDSAISRASSLWASFDPTLTEDQARALGATAVLGTVFTIEAKAVFKQAIGVTSTLRSGRTTGSSAAKETVHAFDSGKKGPSRRSSSVVEGKGTKHQGVGRDKTSELGAQDAKSYTHDTKVSREWTIKGRIKEHELPIEGKIRFVPGEEYYPSIPLPKGPNHGFYDKFGNEWVKGPSRTPGESFEWDVQLSPLGRKQLGWASKDGRHINVSLKGKITH